MYKSTSRAEQFMTRSGSFSTHGTRGGADLLGGGEKEQLTPEQEREAMVSSVKSVEERIAFLKQVDRTDMSIQRRRDLNAEVKALGTKKHNLQGEIIKLNTMLREKGPTEDMGRIIIAVVRESMTKPQWAAIIAEAKRRFDAQAVPDEAEKPTAERQLDRRSA